MYEYWVQMYLAESERYHVPDPFSTDESEGLIKHRINTNQITLWSVGPNGIDDGGMEVSKYFERRI